GDFDALDGDLGRERCPHRVRRVGGRLRVARNLDEGDGRASRRARVAGRSRRANWTLVALATGQQGKSGNGQDCGNRNARVHTTPSRTAESRSIELIS